MIPLTSRAAHLLNFEARIRRSCRIIIVIEIRSVVEHNVLVIVNVVKVSVAEAVVVVVVVAIGVVFGAGGDGADSGVGPQEEADQLVDGDAAVPREEVAFDHLSRQHGRTGLNACRSSPLFASGNLRAEHCLVDLLAKVDQGLDGFLPLRCGGGVAASRSYAGRLGGALSPAPSE